MTVIINGTSGITGVSGSSANPAINSDGDTNTGIFFPAADTVGIVTGGTEIMRVSSAGAELNGSTSGSVTLAAPAVAGASIFTFPVVVSTDTLVSLAATQTLTNKTIQGGAITSDTAKASTSGTTVDFTGIPSWVKRITVMFSGVSTSGANIIFAQLGTGETPTFVATGYTAPLVSCTAVAISVVTYTTGFPIVNPIGTAELASGTYVISNITGNTWSLFGSASAATARFYSTSGALALGAALTAVRITSADAFDAGTINIMYE